VFAAAWPRAPSGPLSAPTTAFTALSRSNALAAALAASLAGVGGADERGVAAGVLSKAAPGATRTGCGGCASCVLGGALPLGCRSGRGGCACGCGFACAGVLRRETRRECGDGACWWGAEVVGMKARAWRELRDACDASSACCALLSTLLNRSREADDGGRVSAMSARTGAFTELPPRASANPSHTSRGKHRASQDHTSRRLHAGRLLGAGERVKRTEQGLSPRVPPPTRLSCLRKNAQSIYTKRARTHRHCCLQHT
jgi:hypothetical protein